jgi:hypothetical protein
MSSIHPVQWLTDGSQRIAQVWRGAINSLDNALRLLLIMDYILDWARDIYREGVIRSLRRLAASDSRSLAYQDSDVFSTVTGVTRVERWVAAEQHGAESNWPEEQEAAGINDAFRSFDTKNAVLRDIRYIQSRFVGLHVTEDNLGAFLKSTTTEQGSKKLALSLLTHLLEGWRVKGETLTAVQSDWTGKDRGLEQRDQEATFFMAATVAAYLTPDWEQTRELSYIAIEEGAVDRLLKYAGLKLADGHKLSDFPFVDKAAFCDILLVLRRQPARANLLACISRVCLSTGILSSENDEHKDVLSVTSVEKSDQGIIYRADTVFKPDTPTKRDFVRTIYNQHRVGRNEPFCPFLRVSSVLDELGLPENPSWIGLGDIEHSRWFKQAPRIPRMPDHGVLFVVSNNPAWVNPWATRLCLFVTKPSALRTSGSVFQELVKSEPEWHFYAAIYEDHQCGWSGWWNFDWEKCVADGRRRVRGILRCLTAFVETLKTREARSSESSQGQANPSTAEGSKEQAWAPKKPNSMWDVLIAPGPEFMSNVDIPDAEVPHSPSPRPTTLNNPGNIRQVNRADMARPGVRPRSNGKQREIIEQRGVTGDRRVRPSRPLLAPRCRFPVRKSCSSSSNRQRSPPHSGAVRGALLHRGSTPTQTAGREPGDLTVLPSRRHRPYPSILRVAGPRRTPLLFSKPSI